MNESTSVLTEDREIILQKLTEISGETGIGRKMIGRIFSSIQKSFSHEESLNADKICEGFIWDLLNRGEKLDEVLSTHNIFGSEDLGEVVFKLAEKGLLDLEVQDSPEDFRDIFTAARIEDYLRSASITKELDIYYLLSNSLYIAGFIIIVMSYAELIWIPIAWIGLGMGILGYVLLTYRKKIEAFLLKIK